MGGFLLIACSKLKQNRQIYFSDRLFHNVAYPWPLNFPFKRRFAQILTLLLLMFGISFTELALVGFVALIVFGPDKMPEVASKIGKFLGTFRKTSDKFRQEFYNSVYIPAKEIEKKVDSKLVAAKDDLTKNLKISPPDETKEITKIEEGKPTNE